MTFTFLRRIGKIRSPILAVPSLPRSTLEDLLQGRGKNLTPQHAWAAQKQKIKNSNDVSGSGTLGSKAHPQLSLCGQG